ncbi:hypothetical protein NE236_43105 [Actinoallomurus purpureus]|uniref:hypothetical protein n=1 Tax=Actinoallomurus purpureus TaxID=478114 RepID=UPI0020936E55|nr:hypothetical protein [Actinoallomurus purpureus]MCO6011757.1 hypothetical protein [Actinoallomurus purpureus]
MTFDPYDGRTPRPAGAPYGTPDPYEGTRRDPRRPAYDESPRGSSASAPDPDGGEAQAIALDRDPYEATMRDPLEDTAPDPLGRGKRTRGRRRRAVEAVALLVLAPGLIVVRWIDDSHQAAALQPAEHITVVRRGQTGLLGGAQWRVLGRDTTAPEKDATTPAGAVRLKLIVEVRPLDAQGVKNATATEYQLRDGAGHVWTGLPLGADPVAGRTSRIAVTSDIPARLVSSVVLEISQKSSAWTRRSSLHGLVFEH